MRRQWFVLSGALLAVTLGVGTGAAAVPAEQAGERVTVGFATFADPADCADGTCDALYLTTGSGVLGGGSTKERVEGIVIVEVYPSAVMDGMLMPIAEEATLSACTFESDVAIDQRLLSGDVATAGRVPLREFVSHDDGSFECTAPNGHWLDLTALFTGTGDLMRASYSSQYRDPATHQSQGGTMMVRPASVLATVALDDTPLAWPMWPGTGSLQRASDRSALVLHDKTVGSVARPFQVTPKADVFRMAIGTAGDWSVYAMSKQAPDGSGGISFGIDGPVWGSCKSPTVVLAEDLSTATASGTMMLYTGSWEDPIEVGEVSVTATWTGVDQAWRWSSTSVSNSPEGRWNVRFVGIHRDATFTLVVDGVTYPGDFAYLEAFRIMQTPTPA